MAIAFVSLLVVVIVLIIGVPILARIFGEAARRGEDTSGESGEQSSRSDERETGSGRD